jgi:hypothetical protein
MSARKKQRVFHLWGFNPWRVAIMVCPVAFAFLPLHSRLSCWGSRQLGPIAFIPLGIVVLLTARSEPKSQYWYWPPAIAFCAAFANVLAAH